MEKLSDRETRRLLDKYRIPVPRTELAKSEEGAAKAARKLGFPLVMKISSPDIVHKTDAKAVVLNIRSADSARAAYRQILKNSKKHRPKARIDGVTLSRMVPPGAKEVIIGAKQDPQFGPVIMFGLGGIFVEVLKDVSFRLAPLERRDARGMVKEIRGYRVLEGVRGEKGVNTRLLELTLMKVSRMMWENTGKGKRIQELDINPLFVDEKRVWAADVRILV